MREELSTGHRAKSAGSDLSEPIFSEPHDCADLVNSLQPNEIAEIFQNMQLNTSTAVVL